MKTLCALAIGFLLLSPLPIVAQEEQRPAEEEIFGAAQPELSQTAAPEDPLRIGGKLYLRCLIGAREEEDLRNHHFYLPMLVDGYFDARPNDRVRAMLIGRLTYDPTGGFDLSSVVGGIPAPQDPPKPSAVLNQLWLRFDIARTVFVTVGKQQVKWGTARFWTPTDFLQAERKNPLEPFDARTGVNMVKLHLPWEDMGWNLYGVLLLDGIENPNKLGRLGAAMRGEVVLGTVEIGLDAVGRYGRKPKWGLDLSAGIGPIDLYAEAAFKQGTDTPRWKEKPPTGPLPEFEPYDPTTYAPAVSGGVTWSIQYSDEDFLTLGGEYFFNPDGYDDPIIYPWLIAHQAFQFFYAGRHYAALFAMLPNPGSWNDTTFILSALGNLTDPSFLARFDCTITVLTHLRFELYASAYFGQKGGEFRFQFHSPNPPIHLGAPVLDLGLSLLLDF